MLTLQKPSIKSAYIQQFEQYFIPYAACTHCIHTKAYAPWCFSSISSSKSFLCHNTCFEMCKLIDLRSFFLSSFLFQVSYFPRLIFHEASKTATMFDFEMYDPERIGLNDMSTEHTGIYNKHITPQTAGMIKACPINSTRNYGRAGIVYNCVEFGSFYHLLTALGMDSWQLQGRVEAVSNIGGEYVVRQSSQ